MEAVQVPFEQSLPSLLEHGLRGATGKPVEVINAGVSGWGTDDALRYLAAYGLDWNPDLVVVTVTLHNDIADNLSQEWHSFSGGKLVENPRPRASFLSYQVVRLKAYVASHLHLYQLWRKVRRGREMQQTGRELSAQTVDLFRNPAPARMVQGLQMTGQLLERIQALVGARGGRVALVLLPLRVQINDGVFSEFVRKAKLADSPGLLDQPQRALKEIASSLKIPVIDLLPTFRRWSADSSSEMFIEWDGHWNEAGHRVATGAVVSGLLAAGVLP
jgi:hypothetical protein